jgi:transposase InsO family protein
MPTLNPKRRPKGPALTIQDQEWIERARQATKRGARKIWLWLRKEGVRIPKHKIHAYATARKWSTPNRRKQKKRNRARYERDHSGSLLHGDWHRTSEKHPHAIIWIDDASRYAFSGGEFNEESGEWSIATFDQARDGAAQLGLRIQDVNTDRGSVFYANDKEDARSGWSEFERHLQRLGIRHVPSRPRNPQTNGKIERHWLEYDRHRWRFPNLHAFLDWYNDQVHDELWIDDQLGIYETPREALQRKLPMETLVHPQSRLAEETREPLTAEVIYAT